MDKKVIGRVDVVNFPKLKLNEISIKIDTGAYTSSIHCKDIEEVDGVLKCKFLDDTHPNYNGKEFSFTNYDVVYVRSSNGQVDVRYSIDSNIKIFNKVYKISLSLSSRDDMRYPVLIGRKFLTKKFIVDTEFSNLSFEAASQENTKDVSSEIL